MPLHAICSIDGCESPVLARGWCNKHYARWRLNGGPTASKPQHPHNKTTPIAERFWRHVDTSGDCWMWTGAVNNTGYGNIRDGGKTYLAHRVSYEIAYGPLDAALVLAHTCDTPRCVRPEHLRAGTQADNMADASAKGRLMRGKRHTGAVLDEERVACARRLYAAGLVSQRDLATLLGVAAFTVRAMLHGRTWAHVSTL